MAPRLSRGVHRSAFLPWRPPPLRGHRYGAAKADPELSRAGLRHILYTLDAAATILN